MGLIMGNDRDEGEGWTSRVTTGTRMRGRAEGIVGEDEVERGGWTPDKGPMGEGATQLSVTSRILGCPFGSYGEGAAM